MIDIHTHLHPPRLFAAIRRWFAERSDWDLGAQPTEPQAVAASLRAAGVERFVFCSYAHKPGMARELNAWLAATSRELQRYGMPLGTVHPDDDDPLGDLRAALDAGCVGLKLHEDVQRIAADDPRLDAVYAELARRNAFVLVHVGPIPWAYPQREGLARIERVLGRHPSLDVVVAHFGAPDSAGYLEATARYRGLHLDTTMVFAGGSPMGGDTGVAPATIAAHADRILYGTDWPNVPYPYANERAGLERLQLPAAALRAILRDNAARLLRLA
jgi:predicted TIM-barrel fold metal-dependent hydrolase